MLAETDISVGVGGDGLCFTVSQQHPVDREELQPSSYCVCRCIIINNLKGLPVSVETEGMLEVCSSQTTKREPVTCSSFQLIRVVTVCAIPLFNM